MPEYWQLADFVSPSTSSTPRLSKEAINLASLPDRPKVVGTLTATPLSHHADDITTRTKKAAPDKEAAQVFVQANEQGLMTNERMTVRRSPAKFDKTGSLMNVTKEAHPDNWSARLW